MNLFFRILLIICFLILPFSSFAIIIDEPEIIETQLNREIKIEFKNKQVHPLKFVCHPSNEELKNSIEINNDGKNIFYSFKNEGVFGIETDNKPLLIRVSNENCKVVITHTPLKKIESIFVAGDFTNWEKNKLPMTINNKTKKYELELELKRGIYKYKLIINDVWEINPDCPLKEHDNFGGFNSVLECKESIDFPQIIPVSKKIRKESIEYIFQAMDKREIWGFIQCQNRLYTGIKVEDKIRFIVDKPHKSEFMVLSFHDKNLNFGNPYMWFEKLDKKNNPLEEILYFIMVDRFVNGMEENDMPVVKEGMSPLVNYMGGDLAGIIKTVENNYFKELGVTALWLSPLHPNPEGAFKEYKPPYNYYTAYHGYWPMTLNGVDIRFGDERKLRKLIDRCYKKNHKVILDMVFNHVHINSDLYKIKKEWFTDKTLPDGRKNIGLFDEFPYSTWFDEFLPTFDFNNPDARKFMEEKGVELLTGFGFSGFRLDAVKHIPPIFFKELKTLTASKYSDFFFIGETLDSRKKISEYISSDMLDGQFDFPLYNDIISTLATETDDMTHLMNGINLSIKEYPATAIMSNFIGNHDFPRFMAYADSDIKKDVDPKSLAFASEKIKVDNPENYSKLKTAFGLIFTLKGVPLIYYGDELGMTGAGDPDNRRMFKGFKNWTKNEVEVLNFVKKLSSIRHKYSCLTNGNFIPLHSSKESIAYQRIDFKNDLIIFINRKEKKAVKLDIPSNMENGEFKDLISGKIFKSENRKLSIKSSNNSILILEAIKVEK